MPKKLPRVDNDDKKRSNQLGVTLPAGARYMLDQLVSQKIFGDSHSEVIRRLVTDQLMALRGTYNLRLPELITPVPPEEFDRKFKPSGRPDVETKES